MEFFKNIREKLAALFSKKAPAPRRVPGESARQKESAEESPAELAPAEAVTPEAPPAETAAAEAAPKKKARAKKAPKAPKEKGPVAIFFSKLWYVIKMFFIWLYRLRGLLLSIPVAVAAIMLAQRNMERLPELVGLNLQATGEFAIMIDRSIAVNCPLLLTGISLLMVILSRRVVYPWLISIFTLVVPYLLWLSNIFPA